jgi:hypothetical protein
MAIYDNNLLILKLKFLTGLNKTWSELPELPIKNMYK